VTGGLWGNTADAALVWGPLDDPGVEYHPLLEEPRVAVLPRQHRLAGRRSIAIAELADDPFVVPPLSPSGSSAWRRFWLLDLLGDAGPPRPGPTPNTVGEMWTAIAAGRAVGTTPRIASPPGCAPIPASPTCPFATSRPRPRASLGARERCRR